MNDNLNCWICGRNSMEIDNIYGSDDPSVIKLKDTMNSIKKSKQDFLEKSNPWIGQVPEAFSNMDYSFVIHNPDNFSQNIPFIEELIKNHNFITKSMSDLIRDIKQEYMPATDIEKIAPELLVDIQNRANKVPPGGLNTLKLADGIKYLQQINDVVIDYNLAQEEIKLRVLQKAKIDFASVDNYIIDEKLVPLCIVCRELMRGFAFKGCYDYGNTRLLTVEEIEKKKKKDEEMRGRLP